MAKHGAPDWSKYRPDSVTFPVEDLAELAVRLGSIVSFDRRGDVVWMDGFEESVLHWDVNSSGGGETIALSSGYSRNGLQCVRLYTSPNSPFDAEITRRLPVPMTSKLGVEFHWSYLNSIDRWESVVELHDGVNRSRFRMRWVRSTGVLEIYDTALGWVTVATRSMQTITGGLFHAAKLVFDYSDGSYIRLLFLNQVYDLSAYAGDVVASATSPYWGVAFTVFAVDATQRYFYIDDVIITQDEP